MAEDKEKFELMTAEDRALALSSEQSVFLNVAKFEQVQRVAAMLAKSDFVPAAFKGKVGNCMIALDIADRLRMYPLMVMQSLYVVHGRPAFEGKFYAALVNNSRRYKDPLEYEWKGTEGKNDWGCRAWAIRRSTEKKVTGPWIDWKMVVAEGWSKKPGSKWLTMPTIMFPYRAAAFFVKTNDPDLAMGMQSLEELEDQGAVELVQATNGVYTDGKPKEKPADLYKTTQQAPKTEEQAAIDSQGDFEDEKLDMYKEPAKHVEAHAQGPEGDPGPPTPGPDSSESKKPWDDWNPITEPEMTRYPATKRAKMEAWLHHHKIEYNPNDTGAQLHSLIKSIANKVQREQTETYTEEKDIPKLSYEDMNPTQQQEVDTMNELIVSGNASAKKYAYDALGIRPGSRPQMHQAHDFIGYYDEAMLDMQMQREQQLDQGEDIDPF